MSILRSRIALAIGAVVVAVVLAVVLIVHLTDGPATGVVEAKRFTPAHTDWITQCQLVGKVTVCHPQPIYYADHWELRLKNRGDDGWRDVDQDTYDRWQVGQFYPGPRS